MEEVHSLSVLTKIFIVRTFLGSPFNKLDSTLMRYFREAESKMVRTFSQTKLPKKVLSDLRKQLWLLHKASIEAFEWGEDMAELIDPDLFYASDGNYSYSMFLLPSGEFDHTKLVRKFVKDPQNPILDRFHYACFYCLESDIRMLWQGLVLDENYPRYRQKDFNNIWLLEPDLVSFWIAYIEGKENEYMEQEVLKRDSMLLNRSFMFCGMKIAVVSSKERAVSYFYEKISAEERNVLHSDISYFFTLLTRTFWRSGKIIDFLFSKMNVHQQLLVLQCDVEENNESYILNSYVFSSLHIKLLEKIGQYQDMLPPTAFSGVLSLIVDLMEYQVDNRPCINDNNDCLLNPFDEAYSVVYDCENLFIRIWCVGSPIAKDCLFDNEDFESILKILFSEKKFRSVAIMLKDSAFERRFHLLSRQALDKWINLATNKDLASDEHLFFATLKRFERILNIYSDLESWYFYS